MIISTRSSESAFRSSVKRALGVILASSTPSCSATIFLRRSTISGEGIGLLLSTTWLNDASCVSHVAWRVSATRHTPRGWLLVSPLYIARHDGAEHTVDEPAGVIAAEVL